MGRNYVRGHKTVRMTINLQGPHYDAMQRWKIQNNIRGGNGVPVEQGLERLPGFKQLLREEQGAYAKNKPTKQDTDEAA